MNFKKNLGTNISMLFLLGLTILTATVYHVASGGIEMLENANSSVLEMNSSL